MFYKVKALADVGRKVILHYFEYNPKRGVKGLEQYCHSIYAYKRKGPISSLPVSLPYIVFSRINQELIDRLNEDDHPILLEGFHCSGIISYLKNKNRNIMIRVHNNEADYYDSLEKAERSFFKKIYFKRESSLLNAYQKKLDNKIPLVCLSVSDGDKLASVYSFNSIHFIACFIPSQKISSLSGSGTYCLYHGNLAISENETAVAWLVNHVFASSEIPFVIAGSGLSKKLKASLSGHQNITPIADPSMTELHSLIQNAHIHVLPSFNNTGVKLKLLNALFNGRFCITNEAGIAGSKIKEGVFLAHKPEEYISLINRLMITPFTEGARQSRYSVMTLYNNATNAQKLSALL